MKTSKLIGAALDWAVAKCEDALHPLGNVVIEGKSLWLAIDGKAHTYMQEDVEYTPSTDWAQGGPIIEREKATVSFNPDAKAWEADIINKEGNDFIVGYGTTPLIAVLRCYVASKLGYEIEIPKELL